MKTDMVRIGDKIYRTALMMLCLTAFISCVQVDVCSDDKHTHLGEVVVSYQWPDNVGDERPDSMLALVNRVVNNHYIGYVTDAETSEGGRYIFGKMYDEEDNRLQVREGEYRMFAFNHDPAVYNFNGLNETEDTDLLNTMDMNDLEVAYVGCECDRKGWRDDLNPGLKYISSNFKPIYYAIYPNPNKAEVDSTQEYTFGVRVGESAKVLLEPQRATQDITFSLPLYAESQVTIDSIVAEVSGIPHKMMLRSGKLDIDTVYRMLFLFDVDENYVRQDTILKINEGGACVDKAFVLCNYQATISVTGLIPNKDPKAGFGAGILQLCVYANSDNGNGDKEELTSYARINLYNTLTEAPLVVEIDEEKGGSYFIKNSGENPNMPYSNTLCIPDTLMFMHDGTLLQTNIDGLKDSWEIY
jgi:hypothetical protein